MIYIQKASCISPQQTFGAIALEKLNDPVNNRYVVVEPSYNGIPPGVLRRMGKSVRIGVGAAMPLLEGIDEVDGIIIGTANCGKEDCVKFLSQINDYDEGMLAPMNFVQSTPNAVAAQIGLLSKNHGYNITHVHLGLAFENAVVDADMMIEDDRNKRFLLGAVDDISTYNFFFEEKGGWFKKGPISATGLYADETPGTIAGEASAMFVVSGRKENAQAVILAAEGFHSTDEHKVAEKIASFIHKHLPAGEKTDMLISGENGDSRMLKFYTVCEKITGASTIARFKHLCGEYPTASASALWLCCQYLQGLDLPDHIFKKKSGETGCKNILIYNTYKGIQHGLMLVSGIEHAH